VLEALLFLNTKPVVMYQENLDRYIVGFAREINVILYNNGYGSALIYGSFYTYLTKEQNIEIKKRFIYV
jgi:hypothetical protein